MQRFTLLLADAARFCRHAPGDRWFVDETYIKVNGVWRYVYRAVDQNGQVIAVLDSARRDAAGARRFFRRALATLKVRPTEVVTDAAPVYPAVLDPLGAALLSSRETRAVLRMPGWPPLKPLWRMRMPAGVGLVQASVLSTSRVPGSAKPWVTGSGRR